MNRQERRVRKEKEKNRLRKLNEYTFGAVVVNGDGHIARCYHRSNYQRFLKRSSNKKLRRDNNVLHGGQYKKAFEYWWELW